MTTRAKPGRLWSLWDIVERYRAENLADLAHFLGRVGMWGHGLELVGGSDDVRRLLATVREEMERAGLRHSLHRLDR
ncbi:MAG: hypothetical protein P4L73_20760, partial [Caulobacteraceae bacterium]|nr:hypothetical protein [Caulobacteraceae bacterium]